VVFYAKSARFFLIREDFRYLFFHHGTCPDLSGGTEDTKVFSQRFFVFFFVVFLIFLCGILCVLRAFVVFYAKGARVFLIWEDFRYLFFYHGTCPDLSGVTEDTKVFSQRFFFTFSVSFVPLRFFMRKVQGFF
jgi:hypothetical protein